MTYLPRAIAAASAALLLLAACGSGGDDPAAAPESTPTSEDTTTSSTSTTAVAVADPAFVQLCGVLASARAGNLDEVRTTFDHGPLHTLADAAIDIDRAVAARLLEAKEAVESDLTDPAVTVEAVAEDLDALADAAAAAYAITDSTQPACEELP